MCFVGGRAGGMGGNTANDWAGFKKGDIITITKRTESKNVSTAPAAWEVQMRGFGRADVGELLLQYKISNPPV